MKTHFEKQPVERDGLKSVESAFSIKATSKAFDILSSALYSDKVGAIVRELSCNAYDSHVAAGKGTEPIEIRLPSSLDPTFYVKDNGIGLTDFQVRGFWKHESGRTVSLEEGEETNLIDKIDGWVRVGGIYNTYFESTKTDSDEFIGQLGLGSKSPFSYVSTFIVEARKDGIKRTYTCFKNEENMPAITLMNAQPTNDSNGVTVSIAVRRDDMDKFLEAAKKSLMYFNPMPKVIGRHGFVPYRLKHTVSGTGWRIRDTEHHANMSGAYVVQGFVAYPVDGYQLEQSGMSPIAAALATVDVDMFVDIGKVEVAASREALSYDKRTITNLIAAFEAAAKEIRTSFQAEFDKCKTVWEVAMMLDKLENGGSQKFRAIFLNMHKQTPFQWNGKDATTTINLDLAKIKTTQLQRLSASRAKRTMKLNFNGHWHPNTSTTKVFEFDLQTNTVVFVDKDAKGSHNAIKEYLSSMPDVDGRKASMFLLRSTSKQDYNQKEIDKIVAMLGNPPIKSIDDLPKAAGQRKTYTSGPKRAPEEKLVFTRFAEQYDYRGRKNGVRRVFSRLTWETQTVDMNAGGFYVELERFTPVTKSNVSIDHLDDIIGSAKALGLIPSDAQIVGMNEKDMKTVAKSGGKWKELFPYLTKAFNDANANGEMYSKLVVDQVMAEVGNGIRDYVIAVWATIGHTVLPGPFKDAAQQLYDLYLSAGKYDTNVVVQFTNAMRIGRDEDKRVITLPKKWHKALAQYEMLKFISTHSISTDWVNAVVKYVNLCDKK
jgi:hypothetical protein